MKDFFRFDFGDGSELEGAGLDNCFNVFVKGELWIEYDSKVSSSGNLCACVSVCVCVCVCGLSEGADWLQPPTQKFKGRLPSVPVGSPLSARITTCLMSSRCVLNKTLRRVGLMFMLSQGFPEAQVVRQVKLSCIDLLVHHQFYVVELSFPRPQWTCSW